jgi:hypothetical protein
MISDQHDRRTRADAIEQLDQGFAVHPHAAVRARLTHRLAIWAAMDIDEAPQGIDLATAVTTGLTTGQPEDPREDPVTSWMRRAE